MSTTYWIPKAFLNETLLSSYRGNLNKHVCGVWPEEDKRGELVAACLDDHNGAAEFIGHLTGGMLYRDIENSFWPGILERKDLSIQKLYLKPKPEPLHPHNDGLDEYRAVKLGNGWIGVSLPTNPVTGGIIPPKNGVIYGFLPADMGPSGPVEVLGAGLISPAGTIHVGELDPAQRLALERGEK